MVVNTRPLDGTAFIAPFVPCPLELIPHALNAAEVTHRDTLVDLGCGDGRILVETVRCLQWPPRTLIGVELDPHLCRHARQRAAEIKSDSVSEFTVYEQDMFTVDLERLGATVLILYLLPAGLGKLAPQLSQWLHNNKAEAALKHYKLTDEVLRRVVTINYQIPGWPVSERIVVSKNVINLYRP